ncbi:MAG: hypothetical protein JWR21_45 [Herminiimonas sp.]|nr:hypothetical protein [Herminiimonas sp.]
MRTNDAFGLHDPSNERPEVLEFMRRWELKITTLTLHRDHEQFVCHAVTLAEVGDACGMRHV